MKDRRHHNNKGNKQVRAGKTNEKLYQIAKRLGLGKKFKGREKP